MKNNKVYTKTGDKGMTSLISGKRVPKHELIIKTYGSIDELIAWIGLTRDTTNIYEIKNTLIEIQKQLMTFAAQLATDSEKDFPADLKLIDNETIKFIEKEIDKQTSKLSPLENFIIPGGHVLISYAHVCRSVCRRAERHITELNQKTIVSGSLIPYINRLSDYFFTLSRTFAFELDVQELKWGG